MVLGPGQTDGSHNCQLVSKYILSAPSCGLTSPPSMLTKARMTGNVELLSQVSSAGGELYNSATGFLPQIKLLPPPPDGDPHEEDCCAAPYSLTVLLVCYSLLHSGLQEHQPVEPHYFQQHLLHACYQEKC